MCKPYFEGLDEYAEGTYECDTTACLYNQYHRCIYNIAPIKQEASRCCHDDICRCDIEDRADYLGY